MTSKDTINFIVESDGVLDPQLRNKELINHSQKKEVNGKKIADSEPFRNFEKLIFIFI